MSTSPIIAVRDLHKTFGKDIHAVRGVNLDIGKARSS